MLQAVFTRGTSHCGRCLALKRLPHYNNYPTLFGSARLRTFASHESRDTSVLELLEERGYVKEIAGDRNALNDLLKRKQVGFYAGIDPTAPSLHLGHLLPLMVLFWLYVHGHHTVSLIGGATARVGDPSGRLTSRVKTEGSVHETNFKSLNQQVKNVWERAQAYGERHGYVPTASWKKSLLNNEDWLMKVSIIDFLQLLGSGMRIGTMLGRDTVKNKMEKGDGMSFAEFTYPLLQGWDWWHMYREYGVQVQIGGSDQYGNIVAGIDAIKHIAPNMEQGSPSAVLLDKDGKLKSESTPMGLTVPLLTTASGDKFGKSAGNAVWLDGTMTSPFDLYGFLLRSPDADVERYLKLFTFITLDEVSAVMAEHKQEPGRRIAQHLLASEVLELVHGREEAAKTKAEHQASRKPSLAALPRHAPVEGTSDSEEVGPAMQRSTLPRSLVSATPFARILFHAGLVGTKAEGARLVKSGGVYVASSAGNTRDGTEDAKFIAVKEEKPESFPSFKGTGILIVRLGKWKVRVIEAIEDEAFDKLGLDVPGWTEWKARGAAP